jgi:hypothetical protein
MQIPRLIPASAVTLAKKVELRNAHYSDVVSTEADGANLPGR